MWAPESSRACPPRDIPVSCVISSAVDVSLSDVSVEFIHRSVGMAVRPGGNEGQVRKFSPVSF